MRNKNFKNITIICLIAMFFLCIAFIFTYPLFLKLNSCIPGFHSTDEPFDALWYSWRIKYSFLHKLSLLNTNFIAYPFGINLYASGVISYGWLFWTHLLSLLFTPVFTYNLQAIINILLNSTLTCLLVYYLFKDLKIAIFSGIVFAFCPYQFVRIWQHLSLTYNWLIVLMLFSAISLRDKISKKRGILFFLSLVLLFSFDFTILYLGMVSFLAFLIFLLFYGLKTKSLKEEIPYFKAALLIAIIGIFLLLPEFFPILKNILHLSSTAPSAFNPYHRSFEDLFAQSARPFSYFLPASSHPLFGNFTEQFIGTSFYGTSFTEHTLYLGWVALILAFLAVKKWIGSNKLIFTKREGFYIGFFMFLAITAWFFSQPPWWNFFGIKLYMPSFFMYKILPMFRAYCRFGIVLALSVAVLAGFGLKLILDKFKTKKIKIALTAIFSGLVLFEFWNYPPFKLINVSEIPPAYQWLSLQPSDTVIAEYPLDADSPDELYKLYQLAHEKRMINSTTPGTYANKIANGITKLSEPATAKALKSMGVTFVLVHEQKYLDSGLIEDKDELIRIPQNNNLKIIRKFPAGNCSNKSLICIQEAGPIGVYEVLSE